MSTQFRATTVKRLITKMWKGRAVEVFYECRNCRRRVQKDAMYCDWCGGQFSSVVEEETNVIT